MKDVTAGEVKAAVKVAGIERIEHHDCGGCGYPTAFLVHDDTLYFDPGCYCSRYGRAPLEPREWSEAADWINMQSKPEIKAKLAKSFGIVESADANR